MNLTWTLSASADEANHDQETDLTAIGSPGGASWASVAPDGRGGHQPWGWTVYSRWNDVDEGDDAVLAEGGADGESGAKAAVAAWVADNNSEESRMERYYRNVFKVEVLSDRPMSPDEAAAINVNDGASGEVRHVVSNRELTRAEMRDALLRQGSDPEFLISGYDEGEAGGDGTGTADPVIPAWLAYAGVPLGQIPESLRESVREHREETS
jgi:hypothetical protein